MAYIMIWSQSRWPWDTQADEARRTRRGKIVSGNWSCGIRKNYEFDSRVYLYRVQDHHGIIASGIVVGETFPEKHWDNLGELTEFVPINFDVVLDLHEILPRRELEANVRFDWRSLYGSGVEINDKAAECLEEVWDKHLEAIGRLRKVN